MQKIIVNSFVSCRSKLSVLIDEATFLIHKSAMIVNIKAPVDGATPEFMFEGFELESQRHGEYIDTGCSIELVGYCRVQ